MCHINGHVKKVSSVAFFIYDEAVTQRNSVLVHFAASEDVCSIIVFASSCSS